MRPFAFWNAQPDRPGIRAHLLSPLARVYAYVTARRLSRPGYRATVPVVCVGNLNLGGTGKTPTVIALLDRLAGRGIKTHVVTRGFGGSLLGPIQVDERRHTAAEVGDEPLLLSAFAPVWVSRDRAAGVRAAEKNGAQVILLDDGFQNPSVIKDLSIVVVDAGVGFGNGRVVPAGPLREPIDTGLRRADFLISIGDSAQHVSFYETWGAAIQIPLVRGMLKPLETGMEWAGLRVLAFAGIGRPAKFFATLRSLGVEILRAQALDDHQPLTDALMKRLEIESKALGAQLVTTEKDAVRLPHTFRTKVLTVPVRLEIEDWGPVDAALAAAGISAFSDRA